MRYGVECGRDDGRDSTAPDGLVPNSAGDFHAETKARANIEVIADELDLEYRRIVPGVELRHASRDNGADPQDDKIKSFVASDIMAEAMDAEGNTTVIVLMGLRNRGRLAETLLGRGWNAHTPAAIVLAASTPRMRLWTGRLDELGTARLDIPDGAPGTIVVGDVANLSARIGGTGTPVRTADAVLAADTDSRRRTRASKERVT